MKLRSALIIILSLVASVASFTSESRADSPVAQVKATIDEILNVVEALPGDKNIPARREKLRQVINPRFDFDEMSKRSLGPIWNDATPEQQKEFISLFSNLLARTYLARIETVKRGMVAISDSENQQAGTDDDATAKATVKTSVTSKGDTFPIDYKLMSRDGKNWRVYDVVIENIGLVSNYRNEFAGIVRKEKFDGLLKRLQDKKEPA
jgi:phospholipid transport system substrate-binding protein